jgi:hypothetical protein
MFEVAARITYVPEFESSLLKSTEKVKKYVKPLSYHYYFKKNNFDKNLILIGQLTRRPG